MNEILSITLQMSLIGMSLVFAALLILWGVMELMMFLGSLPREKKEAPQESAQARKRQAAAIAVAMALSEQKEQTIQEFPLPATAIVSAWQAVMRASNLSKRGPTR
jgi:Na+-transporting methylmalonyl-CoA/oxaloacetate decarboxylase gamma subunit